MPHGPCGGDDRTPGTTGGSTGCNFCHGFAALYTGFYGCRSGIGCCFRTLFRRLLCGLLSGIFGGFCCLTGRLADVIRTVSHLLLLRLCHSFTSVFKLPKAGLFSLL